MAVSRVLACMWGRLGRYQELRQREVMSLLLDVEQGATNGMSDPLLWTRSPSDAALNLPKEHVMTILKKRLLAQPGRICSNCSSEVMAHWTTCPICGSYLNRATTREGYPAPDESMRRQLDTTGPFLLELGLAVNQPLVGSNVLERGPSRW
jgi:hypothetical protein